MEGTAQEREQTVRNVLWNLVLAKYPERACFARATPDGVYTCLQHAGHTFTEKHHLWASPKMKAIDDHSKGGNMWNEEEYPVLFEITLQKLKEDLKNSARPDECRSGCMTFSHARALRAHQ